MMLTARFLLLHRTRTSPGTKVAVGETNVRAFRVSAGVRPTSSREVGYDHHDSFVNSRLDPWGTRIEITEGLEAKP